MILNTKTIKFKFLLYIGTVLTIFMAAIFYWMFHQSKKGVIGQLDQQAAALLQQVVITRAWIADHGGLFVEKRPGVDESPFLPGTNIIDTRGKVYHFRNPAMVTRELSEYADAAGLYRFRLTSLKLKNPDNAPLSFEREALLDFEKKGYTSSRNGVASHSEEDGVMIYRRIVPLRVEKACLECHGDEGYNVGDIRGGLSVMIPMTRAMETIERSRNILLASWLAIISLVSALLYYLTKKLVLTPVDHLHQVAHRLIDGEMGVKAKLHTGDEFEDFANAFNNMTGRLKKGYEGTIKALVAATEARDSYTQGHTARVAVYAEAISREMGLSKEEMEDVSLGATLHDIGKIGITDEILRKSIPLTEEERHEMETHVQKGADIIHEADFLLHALPAILYHHERPDGEGYPAGLDGRKVPLTARIIAVADAYDAMTTDRPYRKGMTKDEAVSELERLSGSQFDPVVVRAFSAALEKHDF